MADGRKLAAAALALPVFGAALIMPPLINVFDVPILLFGTPLEVAYLFAIWIALIGITAILSRKIGKTDKEANELIPRSDGDDD